jgi:hypothetical protein
MSERSRNLDTVSFAGAYFVGSKNFVGPDFFSVHENTYLQALKRVGNKQVVVSTCQAKKKKMEKKGHYHLRTTLMAKDTTRMAFEALAFTTTHAALTTPNASATHSTFLNTSRSPITVSRACLTAKLDARHFSAADSVYPAKL